MSVKGSMYEQTTVISETLFRFFHSWERRLEYKQSLFLIFIDIDIFNNIMILR